MTIIDIIKYEGNNKEIVWKHPGEEFSNVSELRVNKNQDALLVRKEQVLDLFSTGQYTLNAQSAPILSSTLNIKDEEKSSFNCEIYFLNKSEEIPIKWGFYAVNSRCRSVLHIIVEDIPETKDVTIPFAPNAFPLSPRE